MSRSLQESDFSWKFALIILRHDPLVVLFVVEMTASWSTTSSIVEERMFVESYVMLSLLLWCQGERPLSTLYSESLLEVPGWKPRDYGQTSTETCCTN